MKKMTVEVKLPVTIMREGKHFVAYTPALDLATSADTFDRVKKRFADIVRIFFEEIEEKGTVDEVLRELGWRKVKHQWESPTVVAHEAESVKVPITV